MFEKQQQAKFHCSFLAGELHTSPARIECTLDKGDDTSWRNNKQNTHLVTQTQRHNTNESLPIIVLLAE